MKAQLGLTLGILLLASSAHAGNGNADEPPVQPPPSLPSFAAEVRFGPYRPRVEPASAYDNAFGDARRFMFAVEVDWQPLQIRHFGSVGVGGIIGYTSAISRAQFVNPARGESGEDIYLKVWQFAVTSVLRVDVLARDFGIPLVPYGKLGTWMALWSAGNGLGVATASDGTLGRGRTHGLFWAAGLALELDFLDRTATKSFLVEHGVEHTWIFAEYTGWDASGLGQSESLKVGTRTWTFGLGFQM